MSSDAAIPTTQEGRRRTGGFNPRSAGHHGYRAPMAPMAPMDHWDRGRNLGRSPTLRVGTTVAEPGVLVKRPAPAPHLDPDPVAPGSTASALRWARRGVSVVLAGAAGAVIVAHHHDLVIAVRLLAHLDWGWAGLGAGAETASMLAFALLGCRLLRAGGVGLGRREMVQISVAANALGTSPPAGAAFSGLWAYGQLRRRGAGRALGSLDTAQRGSGVELSPLHGRGCRHRDRQRPRSAVGTAPGGGRSRLGAPGGRLFCHAAQPLGIGPSMWPSAGPSSSRWPLSTGSLTRCAWWPVSGR